MKAQLTFRFASQRHFCNVKKDFSDAWSPISAAIASGAASQLTWHAPTEDVFVFFPHRCAEFSTGKKQGNVCVCHFFICKNRELEVDEV